MAFGFPSVSKYTHLTRGPGGLAGVVAELRKDVASALGLVSIGTVPPTRTFSTTAPLTGGGSFAADRTFAITPATTLAPGSMSAADKVKLDGLGGSVGWFDITSPEFGPLDPDDIGPAVALAFQALVLRGGGTVYIPPRTDGLNGNRWKWTTFVDGAALQPGDLLDRMSARLLGMEHQTLIEVGIGQGPLCEIGHSNATVTYEGLTFVGADAAGINAPYVIRIRQSRLGRLINCNFHSIACDGDGFGLVRIVADSTHIEDCLVMACGFFGTIATGGTFSIEGARDTCTVANCRFMVMDGGGFNGNLQNKSSPANGTHIWFGAQGASPTTGPAGTLLVDECQFDATQLLIIYATGATDDDVRRVHLKDCSFSAPSNNNPSTYARAKQMVIEGCSWGNFAAGQQAVGFRGGRLIMRDCDHATNCGSVVKFYGATAYAELWDCDPTFTFDTSLFTPTKRVTFIDGVITVI